jgi:di/tricarboxylate transporter
VTLHQAEAFAIVAGMLALFVSDRLRYDVVAALALSAATLTGVVPARAAFEGFGNPVIVIIASVLVLSRAVAISGVVERAARRVLGGLHSISAQVGALSAAVAILSAIIKNVGTLGIFMPIAVQVAERGGRSPSLYLMPLAFGSLVGGTITLVGTSPNLLISTVREQVTGQPYALLDFAPVGLPLTAVAVLFLAVGWRLLPGDRRGSAANERRFSMEDYTSEALLPDGAPLVGRTVADLEAMGSGEVGVTAIIREQERRYIPASHWVLFAGDVLVLQADPVALRPVAEQAGLKLLGTDEIAQLHPPGRQDDDVEATEAVIADGSVMIGQTAETLHLRRGHEVNLLAMRSGGRRVTSRLRRTRFRMGDVLVLQGRRSVLPDALTRLGLLPLAARDLALGRPRARILPLAILAVAMVAVGTRLLPAEVAFFVAATATVLLGALTPREAYQAIDWPIVVMLGCLIPVGEAVRDTGAAGLLADGLTAMAGGMSGPLAVGLMLVVSMLVTPFLHHAAAVLVMGPVAAAVARNLGYGPDAFLMAVAVGASCDFLTPIGHQNNLLVMGPGGYRFRDYWRLGLPLSVAVATCGTWLILRAWPLH